MKKIWIDAGHGGNDPGCYGNDKSRYEKNDALRFSLELEKHFNNQGFDTVMTRRTDIGVELSTRTKIERDNKCDLAISCHRNWAATATATGIEVWIYHSPTNAVVQWASDVAQNISALGIPLRSGTKCTGVYTGYRDNPKLDYAINRETNSPSMLLELGFITNTDDNAFLDTNLSNICEAVVKASCKFLKVNYKEPAVSNPDATDSFIYRVQVGAFSKIENAVNMKKNLQADGYDAVIVSEDK